MPAMLRFGLLVTLLRSRPRLWLSAAFGFAVAWALSAGWVHHAETRALVGWNAGALLYLALAAQMAWRADAQTIQRRALGQDEGRALVLTLVVASAIAVLLAIGSQLALVKDMHGRVKTLHVSLAALTVVSSWMFTQTLFAFHYAHDFYLARQQQRPDVLAFPGTAQPGYADFFYFACVIGTSGQTADVSFNGSAIRRIGVVHCILAFFFNTTVLALTINIAAGLF
jgi:uncharacterized membrane protein